MAAGLVVPGHIVADAQQRLPEMLHVKVNMLLHHFKRLGFRHLAAHERVAFPPEPIAADVNEGHIGVAVITRGQRGQEAVELLEEDRVAEIRVPGPTLLAAALAKFIRAGFRPRHPVLGAGHAQRDPLALGHPALRRAVQQRPVELALLGLQIRPRHTQIDSREAGKIPQRIRWLQLRPVILRDVRVEVEGPAHVGIDQRSAMVLGANGYGGRKLRRRRAAGAGTGQQSSHAAQGSGPCRQREKPSHHDSGD